MSEDFPSYQTISEHLRHLLGGQPFFLMYVDPADGRETVVSNIRPELVAKVLSEYVAGFDEDGVEVMTDGMPS